MPFLKTVLLLLLVITISACEDPKKAKEQQAIAAYFNGLYEWAELVGQQEPANIEEVGVVHNNALLSLHQLADKHITLARQHGYVELNTAATLMTEVITAVYAQQGELLDELNPRWETVEQMLAAMQDTTLYREEIARLERLYNRVDKFEQGVLNMREHVRQNIQDSGLSESNRIFVWRNVETLYLPILQKARFYNVAILRKVKDKQSVIEYVHRNREEFWINKKTGQVETKPFSSFLDTLMEQLNSPRP